MRAHAITMTVLMSLAAISTAHATGGRTDRPQRTTRNATRAVPRHATSPRPTRRRAAIGLRPRRYSARDVDQHRYQDVVLPKGRDGAHYRLLRPVRKRGSILIERTRHTPAGLVREFSTLGLATRRYQRRSFCPAGDCHPDRLDKTAYREVSLGEVGGERYMLLLPHTDGDPVLIERVVGVTNFADVSPLNL